MNDDKVKDVAVIIESKIEIANLKESDHAQKPRIFFILLGKPSGGYDLSVQSNESIMLSDDGGVFGDPLQELYIMGKTVCEIIMVVVTSSGHILTNGVTKTTIGF
ncbi:MAG: hypothetical protein IPN87_19795 [Saprospiraceae bacterium]|nr:hypothetical protein [Candidatus Brachybacter algidus]